MCVSHAIFGPSGLIATVDMGQVVPKLRPSPSYVMIDIAHLNLSLAEVYERSSEILDQFQAHEHFRLTHSVCVCPECSQPFSL